MKARYYILVSGRRKTVKGTIPVMENWIAVMNSPINYLELWWRKWRFCKKKKIIDGEMVHCQKLGTVEK